MIQSPLFISSPEFLRPIFLTVHQQVTKRIFDDGKDANNTEIGQYSPEYVKRRIKKGLGSSRKVILEFTGQMRNDFVLIEDEGKAGSGFLNSVNADKSRWVEDTYEKSIFDLTQDENNLLVKLIEDKINGTIAG